MRNFTQKWLCLVLLALQCVCGVQAQSHSWKFVTTGDGTTYAIDHDGSLWSWGWNESGQMGIGGGATKISTPTQVGTDTDWKAVYAGQAYAFFIKENGTLWAVGDNSNGVSGVGDGATNHKVPTQVGTDTDWKTISSSRFFGHTALAIKNDGTLWGWGDGRLGQLGIGSYSSPSKPQQIGTDNDWASVSLGNTFTIALKKDGSLWGWGSNNNKTLFNNSKYCPSPVALGTSTDWAQVFAVVETAYGIKKDGTLWVWGASDNNMAGLNNTDLETMSEPYEVKAVGNHVLAITGSDYNRHVAVGENGIISKIYSWGSNADGALGDGSGVAADASTGIKVVTTPVEVKLDANLNMTSIAGGIGYCVTLTKDGKIYGWGKNRAGQLGNFCTEDQMTFVPTPIQCAVESQDEDKVYVVDAADIPAQLNDAKKLILTGEWSTSSFQALTGAIGNNTGFPPAGNSTIEEIDMSQAKIAAKTYLYVAYGMSNYGVFRGLKALKKVAMPAAEQAANIASLRSVFQNCTALEEVDLTGCTNVKNMTDAFFGCENITSIDLSACNSITSCESIFDQCTKLESVKLPALIILEKYAFGSNEALKTIDWTTYNATKAPYYAKDLFQYLTDLKAITVIVPDNMVEIFKADANWGALTIVGASSTGIEKVEISTKQNTAIYTIDGMKVNKNLDRLSKGLYIVNGKKVVVK